MSVSPLVFVHVPKTAGTSFRNGVDQLWGADTVCRDYGPTAAETSDIVRKYVHDDCDMWQFYKTFQKNEFRFLAGHFKAARYMPVFGLQRCISFLREPIQRTHSEYKHWVRHNGYQHCFRTFYTSKPFVNRQVSYFDGVAWPALGMIGFTEHYRESLELIEQKYQLSVPELQENRGRELAEDLYIPEDQLEELRKINHRDIVFYQDVLEQFNWRKKLVSAGECYVAGGLQDFRDGKLFGWAVRDFGDAPVTVEVVVNDRVVGHAEAIDDRPGLRAQGISRNGYVGFVVDLPKVSREDNIACRVAETGQPIPNLSAAI